MSARFVLMPIRCCAGQLLYRIRHLVYIFGTGRFQLEGHQRREHHTELLLPRSPHPVFPPLAG